MLLSLWWESIGVVVLSVVTALLVVRWLVRRRKQHFVIFVLVGGLLLGLSSHTAWRLEQYCNQARPHVDCVPDSYDGPLWTVFRPMRRLYRQLRSTVLR